jgi:hypothetical protein
MLSQKDSALIIIDVQGNLAQRMHDKTILFKNLEIIIRGAQSLDLPIVLTEQLPDKLGPTIYQIAELLKDIQPVIKSSFSCCGDAGFMEKLQCLKPQAAPFNRH